VDHCWRAKWIFQCRGFYPSIGLTPPDTAGPSPLLPARDKSLKADCDDYDVNPMDIARLMHTIESLTAVGMV
jgi:hypothetical protein